MDIKNTLEKLCVGWNWAKTNTGISHEAVDRHIQNMTEAMNKGLTIRPIIGIDTHDTLRGYNEDDPENIELFNFANSIQSREKIPTIISTDIGMAFNFIAKHQGMDDWEMPCHSKRKMHSLPFRENEIMEMLIDDEARTSEFRKFYVSATIPTWDKTLIRFPH